MVKITTVYTRKGDKGETSLVGGRRIAKTDLRLESYGTLDELNSIVGICRSMALEYETEKEWNRFCLILQMIQQKLFDLGSELATHEEDAYEGQITTGEKDVKWLERVIDFLNSRLEPLNSFLLPGGDLLNAHLHQARTVCRRAERQIIRLAETDSLNKQVLSFINRLSDLLFVLSRWVCQKKEVAETFWQPDSSLPEWDE